MWILLIFFLLISEHTQVTPGLPILKWHENISKSLKSRKSYKSRKSGIPVELKTILSTLSPIEGDNALPLHGPQSDQRPGKVQVEQSEVLGQRDPRVLPQRLRLHRSVSNVHRVLKWKWIELWYKLRPYYTMRRGCVLVILYVPKRMKKRNCLAFCNIEKIFSRWLISCASTRVFDILLYYTTRWLKTWANCVFLAFSITNLT